MFFRILKRDLKNKRGINVILFLFMILAVLFVSSSVANIAVISNATAYCMEKGRVGDVYICTRQEEGSDPISDWLDGSSLVQHYTKEEGCLIENTDIISFGGRTNGEGSEKYDNDSIIMLCPQWQEHMLMFDSQDELAAVKPGEIGMLQKEMNKNNLNPGDELTLHFGGTEKTFTLTEAIQDPAFGGDFVGMTRFLISGEDFQEIRQKNAKIIWNYNVEVTNQDAFMQAFNREGFQVIITIEKELLEFSYVMPLLTAGVLIVAGICLIIIAFLILRFTIMFTLAGEYKEIGIMKAIGVRAFTVRKIYLVKYAALILTAAVIGCILSVPISNAMLDTVNENMMMEHAGAAWELNLLCAAAVALMVLVMCYWSTGRLKKFTAIEAIHSGMSGERFRTKSVVRLHRCRMLPTSCYMAVNAILSDFKRYIVLILVFTLGIILIILPMNVLTTMVSDEMVKAFALDTTADFFMDTGTITTAYTDRETGKRTLNEVESKLKEKGYECHLNVLVFYSVSYCTQDEALFYQGLSYTPIGSDGTFIELISGTTPAAENEIALSEKLMKKLEVNIGDTIYAKIGGQKRPLLVTGSYQNYMQMGVSAFISERADLSGMTASGAYVIQAKMAGGTDDRTQKELIAALRQDFPDYTFYDAGEAMGTQLGSTSDQIASVKWVVVGLVAVVNILITCLMMRIFIAGEKTEIALLLGLGCSRRAVRAQHTIRIGIVMVFGILLGIAVSVVLNPLIIRPVFGMMGADYIKIQVNVFEAYLFYPVLMLAVISAAAYLSTGAVQKIDLQGEAYE